MLFHVEQLDQLQTDLEENVGNWAREVYVNVIPFNVVGIP